MNLFDSQLDEAKRLMKDSLLAMTPEERIDAINDIKTVLHELSPIKDPVDCVLWVKAEKVEANDYNPNAVAPPEMRLLHLSVKEDGFTQPIVSFSITDQDRYMIVDGFHRNRVGREYAEIRERILGRLPIAVVGAGDSVDPRTRARLEASTVRHNRARGRHAVVPMADLVADLALNGWPDERIAKELGMDFDEVLRLKQATGLPGIFKDRKYSRAWE